MYNNLKSSRSRVVPFRQSSGEELSWVRPAKGTLFFINILIWLAVCAVVALGVFGLVSSYGNDMTSGKFFILTSAVLVGIGGVGFIICLIGCCGTISDNKSLLVIYVVFLALISFLMLIFLSGVVAVVILEDNLRNRTEKLMYNILPNAYEEGKSSDITQLWDSVQETFQCCGVKSYSDWSKNSAFSRGTIKIPESCCVKPHQELCESASVKEDFFSKETDGCLARIFKYLKSRVPVVIIALSASILCSIINVILGSYIASHV